MNKVINFQRERFLPYHYYTLPVLLLLIIGIADTTYLIYSHYQNYADITFSSFCALSKAINCDTVSQSPWSILFGLPLSIWGFWAYLLFLVLFLVTVRDAEKSRPLWYLLFLLGAAYSMGSVYFGYISATKIKAYCILCLVSYAVNFSLLFYSWIILRRFGSDSFLDGVTKGLRQITYSRLVLSGIVSLFVMLVCIKLIMPVYWHYTFPAPTSAISTGMTENSNPWIGAKDPEITINEYADYQCFQCRKMHLFLRRLIAMHPDKIRLVHHHYPMDHEFNNIIVPEPFHIGSGKMAMIGIYAAAKNKFWEMNDALYTMGQDKQPFNTRTLAKITGFTSGELAGATRHPLIREKLLYDIRQGMKLGITGTPTFVIDDKIYQGSIPIDILKKIMP